MATQSTQCYSNRFRVGYHDVAALDNPTTTARFEVEEVASSDASSWINESAHEKGTLLPSWQSGSFYQIDRTDSSALQQAFRNVIDQPDILETLMEAKEWLSTGLRSHGPEFHTVATHARDEAFRMLTVLQLICTIGYMSDEELFSWNERVIDWLAEQESAIARYSLVISIRRRSQ